MILGKNLHEYLALFRVIQINNVMPILFSTFFRRLKRHLQRFVMSILSESNGTPLHFIFLTDEKSKVSIKFIFKVLSNINQLMRNLIFADYCE